MKVLNLYAGIGGNRKLWKDVDVTAVEIEPKIAAIYQDFFPDDKMIIGDAHEYLLQHYNEYDFIWSSPPCPTHSRINNLNYIKLEQNQKPKYPDMKLYEEIILLKHWSKCKWVVENVISYYEPLIRPYRLDSHFFWCNFVLKNNKDIKRHIREHVCDGIPNHGFEFDVNNSSFKEQLLNNCVKPETGKYIFDCAFKLKQSSLIPRKP